MDAERNLNVGGFGSAATMGESRRKKDTDLCPEREAVAERERGLVADVIPAIAPVKFLMQAFRSPSPPDHMAGSAPWESNAGLAIVEDETAHKGMDHDCLQRHSERHLWSISTL